MLRSVLNSLRNDTSGDVLEADRRFALIAVLAAGARRLERAHLALPHQLFVGQLQVTAATAATVTRGSGTPVAVEARARRLAMPGAAGAEAAPATCSLAGSPFQGCARRDDRARSGGDGDREFGEFWE